MNMNYSYPTTMYESISAQMYAFLVLFTIFAFYHENFFKPKLQKNIFLPEICTMRLPVPGHFYSCVVSKYLLRENEISFLLL